MKEEPMTETTTPAHIDLDDHAAYITALRDVRRRKAELEEAETALVEKIKTGMGDAAEARVDGNPVIRWAWTKPPRRFDRARFVREHAELWDAYQTTGSPSRRFVLLDEPEATE